MKPVIAIYPGSFDPITYGHIDVVERARTIFSTIIVLVARNTAKTPLFSDEERIQMVREVFQKRPNVEVDAFSGLLVDYARRRKASVIVRGLRAVSDFEYEFQMALMNRKLENKLDTVFLVPREQFTYLNSTIVREIARLGGDVADFVPPNVRRHLQNKLRHSKHN
jgi:pantetheine-phosphate adenylyltransferase